MRARRFLSILLLLCACAPAFAGSRVLNDAFESYYEEYLRLNPIDATMIGDHRYDDRMANSLDPKWRKAAEDLDRRYLDTVKAIDPKGLSADEALSREVFLYARQLSLDGWQYPQYFLPVSQFFSFPSFLAQLGSGHLAQPFATVKDYENFIARSAGFTAWVDSAIANMREGMKRGVVQPRIVIEKALPQIAAHVVEDPARSVFYQPVAHFPDAVPASERTRLEAAYRKHIASVLVPAYRRLHAFLQDEYLPHCRSTVGLGALPGGQAWYAYLARSYTTTTQTPAQIHAVGLKEVDRIAAEMERVKDEIGFKGDLQAFLAYLRTDPKFYYDRPEDLLAGYETIKGRVAAALPKLFGKLPKADYVIRPVEEFRAASMAAAQYFPPSADGSRPGIFYVNTYDLKARPRYAMEALSLHEANPGHHFQISRAYELTDVPRFRRFDSYTAFVEGWALYAESLGTELGMYKDPYQYFGRLGFEMWRALRLVVDTGMHAMGWTREQALATMERYSTLTETDRVAEVERYIALPGQALAYKTGELAIRRLRTEAKARLGPRFDVRAFHDLVLDGGALPLGVLEARVRAWPGVAAGG